MPGLETALTQAEHHGYEAVVMVGAMATLLAGCAFMGRWLLKQTEKRLDEAFKREERLALRITTLESYVEQSLMKLVHDVSTLLATNNEILAKLTHALNTRLCLLGSERQDELVERFVDRVAGSLREPKGKGE